MWLIRIISMEFLAGGLILKGEKEQREGLQILMPLGPGKYMNEAG